jgi:hypothetical protein
MGRAEQFFGIRTLAVLEARVECIHALERPVSEVDLVLPIPDAPSQRACALRSAMTAPFSRNQNHVRSA